MSNLQMLKNSLCFNPLQVPYNPGTTPDHKAVHFTLALSTHLTYVQPGRGDGPPVWGWEGQRSHRNKADGTRYVYAYFPSSPRHIAFGQHFQVTDHTQPWSKRVPNSSATSHRSRGAASMLSYYGVALQERAKGYTGQPTLCFAAHLLH